MRIQCCYYCYINIVFFTTHSSRGYIIITVVVYTLLHLYSRRLVARNCAKHAFDTAAEFTYARGLCRFRVLRPYTLLVYNNIHINRQVLLARYCYYCALEICTCLRCVGWNTRVFWRSPVPAQYILCIYIYIYRQVWYNITRHIERACWSLRFSTPKEKLYTLSM